MLPDPILLPWSTAIFSTPFRIHTAIADVRQHRSFPVLVQATTSFRNLEGLHMFGVTATVYVCVEVGADGICLAMRVGLKSWGDWDDGDGGEEGELREVHIAGNWVILSI